MKNPPSPYACIIGGIIILLSLCIFLSLCIYLIAGNVDNIMLFILSSPGGFFFTAFNWAAFFLPFYFMLFSYSLIKRPFKKERTIFLSLLIVPYLTFVTLIKLLTESPENHSLIFQFIFNSIGIFPGIISVILLFLLELYLLNLLYTYQLKTSEQTKQAAPYSRYNNEKHRDEYNPYKERWNSTIIKNKKPNTFHQSKSATTKPESFPLVPITQVSKHITINSNSHTDTPTHIPKVQDFNHEIEDAEYEHIEPVLVEQPGFVSKNKDQTVKYHVPIDQLLHDYKDGEYWKIDQQTRHYGEILMNTLLEFNISAELTGIRKGPVITMYEILPSPGVKLSRIGSIADNIALRLAASRVRIVSPIPGKHAVGIEVPNKKRAIVSFKELASLKLFKKSKYKIPIALGKDISGEAQIIDLIQTPHLLIAGATGSGKSVCVNSIIASILYKKSPEEVKLLLIDPKIVELKFYNDIPHLLTPVITDPKRSFQALQYCLFEMERRYSLLDNVDVRDICSYNKKIKERGLAATTLPHIVIIIDEFADLMVTTGKEMEATIARLASMSRAVGIHLVLATQRPSVDVITGLIKANIPSRIAFMVASKFDSRIIIDCVGAEKLLGQGDMLLSSAWDPVPVRIQGSYISEEEVQNLTSYIKTLGEPEYMDDEIFFDDDEEESYQSGDKDPMIEKALDIIRITGKASTSFLQRKLKIGYNRAARLMEDMEMRGIVGPPNGSKPREILHIPEKNPGLNF